MKRMISILLFIAFIILFSVGGRSFARRELVNSAQRYIDSNIDKPAFASSISDRNADPSEYTLRELDLIIRENKIVQFSLGQSNLGRKIDAYYFPGTSSMRALVLAGVHGSELSSMEVAYSLLSQLLGKGKPYYSVIIIPSLFPDNAIMALNDPLRIGSTSNTGRYSHPDAVDPNRQMPTPGKAYDEKKPVDHSGREIEKENQLLLELIHSFRPQRIANIHAIRDVNYGGVYSDPRTDHNGIALGYSSDSSLAIQIARFVHRHGGNVAGNKLNKKPSALYPYDPLPAPKSSIQKRNGTATTIHVSRRSGVSLGSWGSTAIANEEDGSKNRDAMRILTIEYPGYKRPVDYTTKAGQVFQQKQVGLFASAIRTIFLGACFVEGGSDVHQPHGK